MRLAIREAEEGLRLLQESAMMAGDWLADFRLTAARAKLRQAERHFAEGDKDPEALKPLSPRVHVRPPRGPRRSRFRCTCCFTESLRTPGDQERDHRHVRYEKVDDRYVIFYCGDWEPVARMPARKKATNG